MTEDNKDVKNEVEESVKFKGRYVAALGKRKTAVSQVRLYKKGNGAIMVNGMKLNSYFSSERATIAAQPLRLTKLQRDFDFSILVKGGGKQSQAEAVRHGIASVLIKNDKELKPMLKAKGWLTRDARKKERKKPGLKKARRAPQWSKR